MTQSITNNGGAELLKTIFLLLYCALICPAGVVEAARDFSGTYSVATPEGAMTLTLRQSADGTVTGTLAGAGATFEVSGVADVDEDDESFVEGTLTSPTGGGEFEFSFDDEDETFYLFVTPNDASGTPRLDLATLYSATPGVVDGSVEEEVTRAAQPGLDGVHDARLVGMWATQVIMNTPNGGMATQLFMEIRGDGTLIDRGSRAIGGTPDVSIDTGLEGGGDVAAWRTQGNLLQVSYAGSPWVALAQFEVSGDRLLLAYYDGDRKLWYRQ